MTVKGYQYYEIQRFPDWGLGKKFETQHQDSMFHDVDESPRTIITAVGLSDNEYFRKYHVLHETYQKVRGRYRNEPINGFIAQMEFHFYQHPRESILLIDAPRVFCREVVHRLHTCDIPFQVKPDEIDLIRLGEDLRASIRGGWFGDLKVADVSTIGLFGSTVGESEEWLRYEQIGRLKAIDLILQMNSTELLVKIMSNRGIVIYENLSEALALKYILDIQKSLDDYKIKSLEDDGDSDAEAEI